MENYNKHIAQRLLDSQMGFIHNMPQPTMFGGVRPRQYVLPITTSYDYPSSLSVGSVSGHIPETLSGSFWGEAMQGGLSQKAFNRSLSKVGKKALPIGTRLAEKEGKKALDKYLSGSGFDYDEEMDADEEMDEDEDEDEEPDMQGGKKRYGVSRFVKDLGKISKAVGLKQFLKPIAQSATKKTVEKIEGSGRRGRPRKMKSAVMSMEDLGMEGGKKRYGVSRFVKDLGKISKAVGAKQVLKPIAQASTKKAVDKIEGGKKRYGVSRFVKDLNKISKAIGAKQVLKPIAQALTRKAVSKIEGGAIVSGEDEGLDGSYPPDLSTVYKGGKRGKGARAEIVKKVMKEKGLSLPMASKYVKEHGLY
jgi:hypothetical protein